jgi:predicted porin
MQKKILALAVAGALAPAAVMAQSTVEIYGRANLSLDSWKANGATAGTQDFKRRTRVVDSGSRLGFRVNEGLGGGMRAFVVLETGVNIDSGTANGQSGQGNGSTGVWASRDSYVGLGGGWGDVRLGRQSIWWANGVIAQTGANYINSAVDGLINNQGPLGAPVTRQPNVISYNTPTFGGFNASLSYSPTSEAAGAGADTDGKIYGITGRYTSGALRAQFDWAKNKGQTPAAPALRAESEGVKLGLGWAYAPGSQVSGIIGRLEREPNAAITAGTGGTAVLLANAGDNLKKNFWLLNWEHRLGPWQLLAQYFQSNKLKGGVTDSDTETKGITLAAKYYFSKRTGVYTSYSTVRNENNAWADMNGGGFSSAGAAGLPATAAGADVKVWAVGVMHNF